MLCIVGRVGNVAKRGRFVQEGVVKWLVLPRQRHNVSVDAWICKETLCTVGRVDSVARLERCVKGGFAALHISRTVGGVVSISPMMLYTVGRVSRRVLRGSSVSLEDVAKVRSVRLFDSSQGKGVTMFKGSQ